MGEEKEARVQRGIFKPNPDFVEAPPAGSITTGPPIILIGDGEPALTTGRAIIISPNAGKQ